MLCRSCRRLLAPGADACAVCGTPLYEALYPVELVFGDGTRLPLSGSLTIGRAAENDIRIDDPTVSRRHARVWFDAAGAHVEDAGSSHGTFVDGERIAAETQLKDGAQVRLGDVELRAERRRSSDEAGRTMVVRAGASVFLPSIGSGDVEATGTSFGFRPRVRSGWALKRLPASEGDRRWVLKDLADGGFMRMSDDEAALFQLLDGRRGLPELVAEAERRFGGGGTARLAGLLAGLAEHGLLEGAAGDEEAETPAPTGRLAKLVRPRVRTVEGAGRFFERIYESGGFILFTRGALLLAGAVALVGASAFAWLVFGRYGTPFVVAKKVGLGGLVFLVGRFVVVAFHELAHGLLLTGYGRRVDRAGLKVVLVFPYVFVDTSDAWFEPRQRRVAVSAAGPASDLVLGGVFSLAAAFVGVGTVRDIFFNLAFAAYVGAIFNLNPLLDRDGYNMLVDGLGEPALRTRSRTWIVAKLSGRATAPANRAVAIYAVTAVVWSFVAVAFGIVLSLRYYAQLKLLVPPAILWGIFGTFYALMFLPAVLSLVRPLLLRRNREPAAAETVDESR
ncbi:MAG TPA: FHA domain-containing protein [Gaiellaceae bacterium]|nr:FHA domain-containing protein [Gaiellaceae bacterium]